MNEICDFGILRELRKTSNLSIAELSEKSGVSASVISKLERNLCTAEMETLYRIAKVFGLTLTDIVSLAENRISHTVGEEHYTSGGIRFSRVSYGNLRCMHAFAKKGDSLSTPEIHRDDYELCWVFSGRIRLVLPDERHDLKPGSAIQFDALMHHTYEALENSEFIIVHIRKQKRF